MGYYVERLSGARLERCYALAPPRVHQYLEAEVAFVSSYLAPHSSVLELGCGTGRVLRRLQPRPAVLAGIDLSLASIALARRRLPGVYLVVADAESLAYQDAAFDLCFCIQNGISAMGDVDRRRVVTEAARVTRPGGTVLLSTYTPSFWAHRLDWFRLQAAEGLVGEIDEGRTGDGVIVCKDGFRATTPSGAELRSLAEGIDATVSMHEVDESALFCELRLR